MRGGVPPDLLVDTATVTSANVFTDTQIRPALANPFRYRVWGVNVERDRLPSPPVTILHGRIYDGVGSQIALLTVVTGEGGRTIWLAGGIPLGANRPIIWRRRDSANGDDYFVQVYFTIEEAP